MATPQHLIRRMRSEIAKLVDDTTRYRLTVGEFSNLIDLLNELDEHVGTGQASAPRCAECGPFPAPNLAISTTATGGPA